MKKSVFAAMSSILVLSAALAGCGGGGEKTGEQGASTGKEQTSGPKVLRMNMHSEPPTADPALAEDSTSGALLRATFDGLTRINEDGKPHESVAEKVDVSEDGLTYTFHLRDSKWSNGDAVTAKDFEYAWKRALDPKLGSTYAYQLYYLKNAEEYNMGKAKADEVGVKAQDDKTLVVTLKNPTPFFLELTAFYTYFPVNQKVVESDAKWAGEAKSHVGNGPFKIDTWEHKSKLVLAKNDNYWDKDAVKLDKIDFSMVEDENTELSMFDNGDLDWAGAPMSALPTDAVPALKDSGKMETRAIAGTYMYKFNTEKAPFNNAKIRKAFAYAIDRKSIIDNVTQTNQEPAMGLVPPTMAVATSPYFKDNDAETAKKLLEEGMKEEGITKMPTLTLSFNTSEGHKKIAEAIQDQWKKVLGVDVKLENKEWKVFLDDMHQGKFQIARSSWTGDYNDPYTFLDLFKNKKGSNNDTNWENPKYQELLNKSALEKDPEKRKQILAEAEAIFMDEMPAAPIYYYTHSYVKSDKVKGVVLDGLGFVDWKWADIQ
ncbi:oligopeptide-binding protein OppA [Brevibacillus reuszeri]|uniref:ABC transporter substrate-binding protein n=1 Tax=Brevibacillus reuszeri TaxID=54915 RepID=A0A0K9YJT8_9BACL|nr:peptide ABC transporter substrate-binding protein [Brevibacillus reuszeri]KNB68932.1 ABC transporter substrate-binding protein [Brevibacillus reuszeri]MED1859443.1 peptide ABC transporter substrate-binding protein [Brevibacillus reuszeri]GED71441.1 oligopeptide-binding protein OppA [Brevibacillus reuszeri]